MELFSFHGRANRLDFWLVVVGLTLVILLMSMLGGLLIAPLAHTLGPVFGSLLRAALSLILTLLFLWPILAVGVRRAHDRGASGYWFIGYQITSLVMNGWSASMALRDVPFDAPESMVLGIMAIPMILWALFFLVTLGFLPGQNKPNRYGSPGGTAANEYRATVLD